MNSIRLWLIFVAKGHNLLTLGNLKSCTLCPHRCGTNRLKGKGYCHTGVDPAVAAVFLHKGEEPVLSGENGICNVFFAHCNMQCVYCQNHQISRNSLFRPEWSKSVDEVVNQIIAILEGGVRLLGFVSPTHQTVQLVRIIDVLHQKGHFPTVVYNSSCYENAETLRELEGLVDVYLPDFKYASNSLGLRYSGVSDYVDVAKRALREMCRQKGVSLLLGDDGLAEFGLIVRHLVLPGHAADSVGLLKLLANEFSPKLHISLMSQYYPPQGVHLPAPINTVLSAEEYGTVLDAAEQLGFRGWRQATESNYCYRPNFEAHQPFAL